MLFITKYAFVLLYLTFPVVYLDSMVKNANNYGPYELLFDHFNVCKGPKSKNLTTVVVSTDVKERIAIINMTYISDVKIDEIKVEVYNVRDNRKNFLWNYKLNDPCRHYAVATIIKEHTQAINCVVKKGDYSIVINFAEVMSSFLGSSFFYGTYAYRANVISKKGNIACFNCMLIFEKKIVT